MARRRGGHTFPTRLLWQVTSDVSNKVIFGPFIGISASQTNLPHACFQHQPNGGWGLLGDSSQGQPPAPKGLICYCLSCPDQIVQLIMIYPVFLLVFPMWPGIPRPGCLFVCYSLFPCKPLPNPQPEVLVLHRGEEFLIWEFYCI